MTQSQGHKQQSLLQFIWRAFFRTALTPLLLVEVVLIGTYVASNVVVRDENLTAIRTVAANEVTDIASRESNLLSQDLRNVHASVNVLTDAVTRAMTEPLVLAPEQRASALSRYAVAPDGQLYSLKDDGGSALFYSAITKIGEAEQDKVLKTERIDPLMRALVRNNSLWVQAYFNTRDSMNRIYPFLDVVKIYPPSLDVTSFNFYYEADAKHNPSRGTVWTDVYVDPAGQGWMASCIAPVYRGDFFEGVVGADITVATMVKKVLDLKIPWDGYGMLVGRTGTILALPAGGERDFNLVELTDHDYEKAIQKDTFKPENFNLFKRTDLGDLSKMLESQPKGITLATLSGQSNHVAWSTIEETGWKLMVVVPRPKIDEQAVMLSRRIGKLAVGMVVGLVVFYTGFLLYLWRQAQRMSRELADPLVRINAQVGAISRGEYDQTATMVGVVELDATNQGVVDMGRQLGENQAALLKSEAEKREIALQQERLAQEVEIAATIQQAMLPQKATHREFEFAGTIQPADEVGGDYYDVLSNDDKLWITIGDVSSHGLGAGLVMMTAQSITRGVFATAPDLPGDDALRCINRILHRQMSQGMGRDHYITGQMLLYRGAGAFDCVGGHVNPIIIDPQKKASRAIDTTGPWLGIRPQLPRVPITRLTLAPGEILCLYSDGITEAKNENDEEYGTERFMQDLCEVLAKSPTLDTCIAEVLERVATFSNKRDDDRTIVLVRYRGN